MELDAPVLCPAKEFVVDIHVIFRKKDAGPRK
jgi:hypothetical protein